MTRPPLRDQAGQIDGRLRMRLRMFTIIAAILTAVVASQIVVGELDPALAIGGFIVGALAGVVASRMFHLSWDAEADTVVGRIDRLGMAVLIAFIAFSVARTLLLPEWLDASKVLGATLSVVGGTMLGRVVGMARGIRSILAAWAPD